MTFWQGLFVIGLLYFILAEVTHIDSRVARFVANIGGIIFTCWAGWELASR